MKKLIPIFAIVFLISIGIAFYYFKTTNNRNNTYEAERTSTETNTSENNNTPAEENPVNQEEEAKKQAEEAQKQAQAQAEAQQADQAQKEPTEAEVIASFSTKIYTKDSNRQNNITITCSTLNDTDVEDGETFSFCNTVGQSSSSKGYKKADVFKNGEKTKGYGGR